jgi:pimeloyl-ACP methyl ester carboxylesterase
LVDLPGTGQSEALEDIQAEAVLRTLSRFLANEGPVILVGHSLGGVIAVRLAAQAPANVRALVLLDAPLAPFPLAWWQRAALHPWVWTPMLHLIGAIRATRFALHRLGEHPTAESRQSIRLLGHELATRSSRRVLLAYYRSFLRPDALHQAELDLARIRVPVLVLWGSHDHVVPARVVAETLADLPAGTPVTTLSLPAGHLAPLEVPSEVASAISKFARDLAPPTEARSPAAIPSGRRGAAVAPARDLHAQRPADWHAS